MPIKCKGYVNNDYNSGRKNGLRLNLYDYLYKIKVRNRKQTETGLEMILDCQKISKSFGTEELFGDISFHLLPGEKCALTGANGCGKSTLLKIITGQMHADSGNVVIAAGTSIGYLAQHQETDSSLDLYHFVLEAKKDILETEDLIRSTEEAMRHADGTALEDLMTKYSRLTEQYERENGYAVKSETTGVLKGLGFDGNDFSRCFSTLSGGQKTRVVLGKVLLSKPDLLLLDEPTNHLDMSSVRWLENYLSGYQGTLLIVSHDRYFLDRIVSRVIEIEDHTAVTYKGNYTEFSLKKAEIRKARLNEWFKQQAEIRKQQAVIDKLRSFNREKSVKRAESREKALKKLVTIERPSETDTDMRLKFEPWVESGNDVLEITELSKAFGTNRLFSGLDLLVTKGEKIAVIGDNGTGKSTLLKIITGSVIPDTGDVRYGAKVEVGYYDQENQNLDFDKTIFEEISDEYPDMTETEIRNVCAGFLFTGDDVFTQIRYLSGGERGRVALARLMLSEANFLILDEPTNHLDIQSREILEDAIRSYTGTVLYVSHDRYFINRTATRILELEGKTFTQYLGNYDYYLEKKNEPAASAADGTSASGEKQLSDSARDWKAAKEELAAKRKHENDLKKTEARIEELEALSASYESEMNLPENATDPAALTELSAKKAEADAELSELYERWAELAE